MTNHESHLNQWQIHNLSVLTPEMAEQIQAGNWSQAGTSLLQCVKCGGYKISGPIAKWFDLDGRRFLCYSCQKALSHKHGPIAIKEIMLGVDDTRDSDDFSANEFQYPSDTEIYNEMAEAEWQKRDRDWRERHGITLRQSTFLRSLILDRVFDEEERESMLSSIQDLSRRDASEEIDRLLSQPAMA